MTYATCRTCTLRFFAGQNPDPRGACGVCQPRDEEIAWERVPNLRQAGELVLVAFQDAAAGEAGA